MPNDNNPRTLFTLVTIPMSVVHPFAKITSLRRTLRMEHSRLPIMAKEDVLRKALTPVLPCRETTDVKPFSVSLGIRYQQFSAFRDPRPSEISVGFPDVWYTPSATRTRTRHRQRVRPPRHYYKLTGMYFLPVPTPVSRPDGNEL
jgi:hypothetical protein